MQVRKKWFDTKSLAKNAVVEYQKEYSKTDGGVNTPATPSELQFKIASLIGPIFTAWIPNTKGSDTTEACSSSSNDAPLSVQPKNNSVENLGAGSEVVRVPSHVSLCAHLPNTPAAKRSKTSKREQQNEEMIDVEEKIQGAVCKYNAVCKYSDL